MVERRGRKRSRHVSACARCGRMKILDFRGLCPSCVQVTIYDKRYAAARRKNLIMNDVGWLWDYIGYSPG